MVTQELLHKINYSDTTVGNAEFKPPQLFDGIFCEC